MEGTGYNTVIGNIPHRKSCIHMSTSIIHCIKFTTNVRNCYLFSLHFYMFHLPKRDFIYLSDFEEFIFFHFYYH